MATVYQLKSVTKAFGSIIALDGINLDIQQGEIIGLIGSSGSGKTTLLKLLNAQHQPTTGDVLVSGEAIHTLSHGKLRKARSKIAYIPQHLGLVPNLKVFQNIFLGKVGLVSTLRMLGRFLLPAKKELTKIHKLLDRTGIADKLYATTSQLSGGQQQRVAVARALYQESHTILADEPVSSVDPARAHSLISLLTEIAKEHNLTLIMSIHNLELAKEFFPRLIGLKNGKVHFDSNNISDQEIEELYQLSEEQLTQ